MSGLEIPLPTESPADDPGQYIPLLLSAIEGFLLARDVWATADYPAAYNRMQQLMEYLVGLMEAEPMPGTPVGGMEMWLTNTPPDGWLFCNGDDIGRTMYPELFTLWGTTYGAGDGVNTFGLPDFTWKSPMGVGLSPDGLIQLDPGGVYGTQTHTLTTAQLPAHNHPPLSPSTGFITTKAAGSNGLTTTSTNRGAELTTGNRGDGVAHNNVHPVLGVNIIVWPGVAV